MRMREDDDDGVRLQMVCFQWMNDDFHNLYCNASIAQMDKHPSGNSQESEC